MVTTPKTGVDLLDAHSALMGLHNHLSPKIGRKRFMLRHHLIAELIPTHMAETNTGPYSCSHRALP